MAVQRLPRKSNSATRIGVGVLIALTLSTGVATVVNLQAGEASTGPTASATATSDPSSATNYVLSLNAERRDFSNAKTREKTLSDVLPNHLFVVGDAKAVPLGTGIVFGTISEVTPGAAYVDEADGSESVAFTSEDADWRVVVLTVEVESALGEVSGSSSVSIGMVVNGAADIDRVFEGYRSMGDIVAILNGPGKYEFNSSVYSVRQNGGLLGLVSADGDISFPALPDTKKFVGDLLTVSDVLAEATSPVTVTKVNRSFG